MRRRCRNALLREFAGAANGGSASDYRDSRPARRRAVLKNEIPDATIANMESRHCDTITDSGLGRFGAHNDYTYGIQVVTSRCGLTFDSSPQTYDEYSEQEYDAVTMSGDSRLDDMFAGECEQEYKRRFGGIPIVGVAYATEHVVLDCDAGCFHVRLSTEYQRLCGSQHGATIVRLVLTKLQLSPRATKSRTYTFQCEYQACVDRSRVRNISSVEDEYFVITNRALEGLLTTQFKDEQEILSLLPVA
jgi:hypothetical protein